MSSSYDYEVLCLVCVYMNYTRTTKKFMVVTDTVGRNDILQVEKRQRTQRMLWLTRRQLKENYMKTKAGLE